MTPSPFYVDEGTNGWLVRRDGDTGWVHSWHETRQEAECEARRLNDEEAA